jgi:hypothetical protein
MDRIETRCSCGAILTIQTDWRLEAIVAVMFKWQELHAACRRLPGSVKRAVPREVMSIKR